VQAGVPFGWALAAGAVSAAAAAGVEGVMLPYSPVEGPAVVGAAAGTVAVVVAGTGRVAGVRI